MTDRFSDGQRVTRAKVYVSEVAQITSGYNGKANPTAERVTLRFVNGNDPDSENRKFWEASPTAEPIQLTIANPAAWGVLKPGGEYYLDFIEAVRTPGGA